MYLNYYGFRKEPFQITPDPEFLFLSPSHKEAMGSIIYGIEERKGFVAIFGGVGVGKTTILRAYLERVNKEQARLIYIFNANLSFESLLKTIYQELSVPVFTDDIFLLVNHLHEVLIEEYKKKHTVVLIIDEAQNMPVETLENLRMLSNLETTTDKLIQIVLIGQPEFEERLNQYELRQLRQRVAIRATILPLSSDDSVRYIEHRLAKVMNGNEPVLTKGAIKEIVKHSKGIPRVINIICDNAFITGYGYQKKPVTARIVREICADFRSKKLKEQREKREYFFRWKAAGGLALAVAIAGAIWMIPDKEQTWAQVLSRFRAIQSQPEQTGARAKAAGGPVVSAPDASIASRDAVAEAPGEAATATVAGAVAGEEKPTQPPATVAERQQPRVQKPEEEKKATVAERVVTRGDTLSKLIVAKYGFFDADLLQRVKRNNPSIKDVDKIYIGDTIVFPFQQGQGEPVRK